jgi:hypothetical protein
MGEGREGERGMEGGERERKVVSAVVLRFFEFVPFMFLFKTSASAKSLTYSVDCKQTLTNLIT